MAGFVAHRERVAAAGSDRFATTSVKIMLDGVAENRTASMLSPYLDGCGCSSGETGLSYLDRDLLLAAVPALDAAGFDVHVHVIGDRAVRDAPSTPSPWPGGRRPRGAVATTLAHLQVVHPDDVPRFAALDVTANAQALWACEEEQMTALTTPLLGPERNSWQYPFGSCCAPEPVSSWGRTGPSPPRPVAGRARRGEPHPARGRRDRVLPRAGADPHEALHAYTEGSAWINRHDEAGPSPRAPSPTSPSPAWTRSPWMPATCTRCGRT